MRLLIYKSRIEPLELIVLKTLESRIQLSKKDQQNLYALTKGFEGEQKFDSLIQTLNCDCIVLNDLLLTVNNQTFQIDSILILKDQIFLFEIKNYSGDFYYDSNRFLQKDGFEISNPLIQLQRTESLMRQLLHKLNINIPIHSKVLFVNPEFSLYQAQPEKTFILPNQVNRFLKTLNLERLKLDERHRNIAEKLNTLHIQEYPLKQYPTFSYHELQKGIKCVSCETFKFCTTNYRREMEVLCLNCRSKQKLESAVIRTAKEFQILFPDEKITTPKVCDWCDLEISQKTIQRILNKHFTKSGANRWIYYT
ncbi:nuclease-related domain-containing protein [Lysinibacillus sp. SGAir0095]|uniref:nuclease-related domain-containing protein n=1 Tax=Lysinibacillus sp. SGAir0095 TaxID=2070463 RepID=UPI0010CD3F5C|nr:nuclease-related domain-containing protein [Lysinibacillus sp. SGAir0095]QCR31630.1 nuclease [Lysinibacillus sp. SGAir0095]